MTRGPFLLVRFLWASKENEQFNHITGGAFLTLGWRPSLK